MSAICARIVDPLEEVGDRPRPAALDDRGDDGPVLTGELGRALRRLALLDRVGLDPGCPTGARHAHAEQGPVDTADDDGVLAATELPDILDHAHGADAGVAAVQPRHQQVPPARRRPRPPPPQLAPRRTRA